VLADAPAWLFALCAFTAAFGASLLALGFLDRDPEARPPQATNRRRARLPRPRRLRLRRRGRRPRRDAWD
jgi:hypothetical protein